jgi:hypothetical protein
LKTQVSVNPRPIAPGQLVEPVVTTGPDAVYIASTTDMEPVKCVLDRYLISKRTWDSRVVPLRISHIFPVGSRIYFTFRDGSGLARYDWDSGQTILLASSRRRPALNQFDDRAPYTV